MTPQTRCAVRGCIRGISVWKHRLCWAHYKRYIKHGDPGKPQIRKYHKPYKATA